MDPVVSQFVFGALIPGSLTTVCMAAAWAGSGARWAAPGGRANPDGAGERQWENVSAGGGTAPLAPQAASIMGLPPALVRAVRNFAVPALVAGAIIIAQTAITQGWALPPTDAFSWLGVLALVSAGVGLLLAIMPSGVGKLAAGAAGVCGGLMLAAYAAKLGPLGGAMLVAAGLIVYVGLTASLVRPTFAGTMFVWLWLVACSQSLILAFASLRLGVLVHCIAAVGGGIMVVSAIWPRLHVGVAGTAALAILIPAVFAQGYSFGTDATPLWVRLGAMGLLAVCPAVFGVAALVAGKMWPRSPFIAGLVSLAVAAVPAALAVGGAAWAYLRIED